MFVYLLCVTNISWFLFQSEKKIDKKGGEMGFADW